MNKISLGSFIVGVSLLTFSSSFAWTPKYLKSDAPVKAPKVEKKPVPVNIVQKKSKKKIRASKQTKKITQSDLLAYKNLTDLYKRNYKDKKSLALLKKVTLKKGTKAVPVLVKVMKEGNYPIENRWIATFLLGRIMGQNAAPFIAKFASHPHWMMRMASLKTLLALKQKKYAPVYQQALNDESLIVRTQAVENVKKLKIRSLGPALWAMIFSKRNYAGGKGNYKRLNIVKRVIEALGTLKYKDPKVTKAMITMVNKEAYSDLFQELDVALSQITGKKSPQGEVAKKHFWKSHSTKLTTI